MIRKRDNAYLSIGAKRPTLIEQNRAITITKRPWIPPTSEIQGSKSRHI